MRAIYGICSHQALLPRSLEITVPYDPNVEPVAHGGFANVWKVRYRSQDVAIKVLRVYKIDDIGKIKRVGFLLIWHTY